MLPCMSLRLLLLLLPSFLVFDAAPATAQLEESAKAAARIVNVCGLKNGTITVTDNQIRLDSSVEEDPARIECAMAQLTRRLNEASPDKLGSRQPSTPHLRGLSSAEADKLIAQLQDLQRKLRGGEAVVFELLSGAVAYYPQTKVSPRETFLEMPFEHAFIIERVPTSNRLWRPHRITIRPQRATGEDQLIWHVEVVLGFYDNVERVQMVYKPPAPF
jgi:hypothetical protein